MNLNILLRGVPVRPVSEGYKPLNRNAAIVLTTIFEPEFLSGYLENLRKYERESHTTIYIIIDRKTPATVFQAARDAVDAGFQVVCPTLQEQEEYLKKLGLPAEFIPWNTDNRRNIGYLMALESGCELLISIDDDNFILPGYDFVGEHQIVGSEITENITNGSDGWFNICSLLTTDKNQEIFARGFPYYAQRESRQLVACDKKQPVKIAMNAGLWLDEPDVDAVFRLSQRPKIQSASSDAVVLDAKTWTPVNTQNTALTRDAALTYYYVKMGFPLQGLKIDRFGDILSGYLTQKCIKHLGQAVRLGSPVLDHRRSTHNLFKDLYHELAGIVLIEDFLPWLVEQQLEGGTTLDAYESLSENILQQAGKFQGFVWDDGGREFLKQTAEHMQIWLKCVKQFA